MEKQHSVWKLCTYRIKPFTVLGTLVQNNIALQVGERESVCVGFWELDGVCVQLDACVPPAV